MTATIIGIVLSFILVWRWNVLQSQIKNLERQTRVLKEWNSWSEKHLTGLDTKIKTMENVLRNVRANQITQRENTPAERPTIRNRELMRLGRDIQAGVVDKEIKRISKDG